MTNTSCRPNNTNTNTYFWNRLSNTNTTQNSKTNTNTPTLGHIIWPQQPMNLLQNLSLSFATMRWLSKIWSACVLNLLNILLPYFKQPLNWRLCETAKHRIRVKEWMNSLFLDWGYSAHSCIVPFILSAFWVDRGPRALLGCMMAFSYEMMNTFKCVH